MLVVIPVVMLLIVSRNCDVFLAFIVDKEYMNLHFIGQQGIADIMDKKCILAGY